MPLDSKMRVVPLFETLDDLDRSCDTMAALFAAPVYHGLIRGKQVRSTDDACR